MAKIIREHIHNLIEKGLRQDGRSLLDYRKDVSVEYGISPKSAEGSARVKIGDTEVVAGIKLGVGAPYPDQPDKGSIMVGAELSPLASDRFETGPPSIESIEISRVVDRGIRESGALDFKKLCIKNGELVWTIFIDIYPINDAGNIRDACALAALAALKDAKFPELDKKTGKVDYEKKTKTSVPLDDEPIEVTVLKIHNDYVVDPSVEEEEYLDARLTVAFLKKGEICAMQKGGREALSSEDISKMVDIAEDKEKILRKAL
jgi:exosome complex component RRP42|tara:strand:- start:12 stop:794 length:783 start_codon:yes stop_codon:yes gene_type:complete